MDRSEVFIYTGDGMISGQGDAVSRTYDMYFGKSARAWFVPSEEANKANNIYVTAYADWGKTGQGFAGAHLTLKISDGSTFTLRGGWHTNADALFEDTGVDVRDTHLTYGAFGLEKAPGFMAVTNLIYKDEEPTLGRFHRIQQIALNYAREHDVTVQYVSGSRGGGSSGAIYPDSEAWWE